MWIWVLGVVASVFLCIFFLIRNPVFYFPVKPVVQSNRKRLEADVKALASQFPTRSIEDIETLNKAADYIKSQFTSVTDRVEEQRFNYDGREYRNIICSFGPKDAPRIIIGAHYDVAGLHNPGADDNASGIAGVLELARMLSKEQPDLKHRVDLLAYTLEEPPYFNTPAMGSFMHANQLASAKVKVRLMVSAEMIGYFTDREDSQNYPVSILKWIYPSKGNFVGVVGLLFDRYLVARTKKLLRVTKELPVYSINAPRLVQGVDFSDHRNYWKFNFPAVMVTDTAFFRNPNYHSPSDTPNTLDYERMSKVVDGLYRIALYY